jgi:DNA repair ATPase RecN
LKSIYSDTEKAALCFDEIDKINGRLTTVVGFVLKGISEKKGQ